MTPDEALMCIDGYHKRLETEDRITAHHVRNLMGVHLGRKTPKAEKLRFFKKDAEPLGSKDGAGAASDGQTDVVDLNERRAALKEILRSRNRKARDD